MTAARFVLSATGVPAGASFSDTGNNTGTFNWTPAPGQAATYMIGFHAANLNGATETISTRITVLAPPPPNDDFDGAVPVTLLPFTVTQSTSGATTGIDDPFCGGNTATV